ncbi:MAG: PKD domain-containing protein, partial [Patescibacteria group bacterium]
MNHRILTVGLLAVTLILSPLATKAQTITQTPSISELQSAVVRLQKQLVNLQSSPTYNSSGAVLRPIQTTTPVWCYNFENNLTIGASGDGVRALHYALFVEGFNVSDRERTAAAYGESTASAVSGFQIKYRNEILTPNGLSNPTGYFGPASRRVMNRLYRCSGKVPMPIPVYPAPTEEGIDLAVTSFTMDADGPKAVLCNLGSQMIPTFPGYVSVNGWSVPFPNMVYNADNPGSCMTHQWPGFSWPKGDGIYRASIVLDPDNLYRESNEFNNKLTTNYSGNINSSTPIPMPVLDDDLVIVSPKGGESWQKGSTHPIIWESSEDGDVFAKMSIADFSGHWYEVFSKTENDGKENWTIPMTIKSGDYWMSVSLCRSDNNSCLSQPQTWSNSFFKIYGSDTLPQPITIEFPNGGEAWQKGTTQRIGWNWRTLDFVDQNTNGKPFTIFLTPTNWSPSNPQLIIKSDICCTSYYDWKVDKARNLVANQDVIVPANTYNISVCAYNNSSVWICDETDSYFKIYGDDNNDNRPPTISGVSGPTTLNVNQGGTWTVRASDPENGNLSYSVRWGDEGGGGNIPFALSGSVQQTATFTHTYAQAGTYYPTFTVTDSAGQSARTSLSVVVGGGGVVTPQLPILSFVSNDITINEGDFESTLHGGFVFRARAVGGALSRPNSNDIPVAIEVSGRPRVPNPSFVTVNPDVPSIPNGSEYVITVDSILNTSFPGVYRMVV